MSIFRLAADTVQRQASPSPGQGGGAGPPGPGGPAAPPAQKGSSTLASAIAALTTFIPGETITLFVAVTGIIAGWKASAADTSQSGAFLAAFYVFLCLSPIFFVVAAIIAAHGDNKKLSVTPRFVWRFFALMVAFIIWACAVSNDTMVALLPALKAVGVQLDPVHMRDIVSIVVLITSGVLSTLDGLFPQEA